jgi:hypothetical protein
MAEESTVRGTQVVQAGLAVRRDGYSILWTAAVAGGEHIAASAGSGKPVALGLAEALPARIRHQIRESPLFQISDEVVSVYVVITHVKSAVVLQDSYIAAGFSVNAQRVGDPIDRT